MSREIGAYEAKTKLPELLRAVARGERFTITNRGVAIADLVPSVKGQRTNVHEAIERMKNFRSSKAMSDARIKAAIARGRR